MKVMLPHPLPVMMRGFTLTIGTTILGAVAPGEAMEAPGVAMWLPGEEMAGVAVPGVVAVAMAPRTMIPADNLIRKVSTSIPRVLKMLGQTHFSRLKLLC